MNSLLRRQIKKHLTGEQLPAVEQFLTAVSESYTTYDDHIAMLQRAIKLSSDELYEANHKLREEAKSLKEINKNLEFILASMNLNNNPDELAEFNAIEHIRQQSEEIIRINAQREDLLKSLEVQNQELNEYAHVVSHDLKSPLRSINALINWIIEDNKDKLDEESSKSLNLILFNVEKMDLLIKGILDYSSIDRLESENRLVDFNDMVDEILRTIDMPESIKVKINNELPAMYGNFFRFRQLFQNLIENSIKYNDKEIGLIEIGYTARENEVEFYVKDNGRGIPAAYFDKIFNVFTKLDSKDQSSGIGLSIVKKIVNFYGGKIWVESTEGKETTFFFTLVGIDGV
ncbi:histidine kinase [Flavobacterium rivuli WB 3.3-2 = DSM 21788]|uniref:histidine kinase n=1 Tax=Flavobacterium rivuli WB 3.3-2 = DSM 21788 TaxID=1121895 RepID=A0A0A2MGC1_9FLAO|nr:ATP-binding protein [Flavobacterium rivuli]KGO87360.1 histidine kinase [Flavobacterium rivuli WB 3.3-2 = DSM 21788]